MANYIYILPREAAMESAWHAVRHAREQAADAVVCVRNEESEKLLRASQLNQLTIGAGGTFDFATPLRLRKLIDNKEWRDTSVKIVVYTLDDALLALKVASLCRHKDIEVKMMYFTAEPPTLPLGPKGRMLQQLHYTAAYSDMAAIEPINRQPDADADHALWVGDIVADNHLQDLIRECSDRHIGLTVIGSGEGRYVMPCIRLGRHANSAIEWLGQTLTPENEIAKATEIYVPRATNPRSLVLMLAPDARLV